ncbi:unnamed protein product, partial [marine sediment metagenome]
NAPSVGGSQYAQPTFADLDGDGDYDLLIGRKDNYCYGYKNTGSISSPIWTYYSSWNTANIGSYNAPALADLDGDGDYDLLVGQNGSTVKAYENTGSTSSPTWAAKTAWNVSPGVTYNTPAFADIDDDGDYDLLIGNNGVTVKAFENTGSTSSPAWTATSSWDVLGAGTYASPSFADIDSDGDQDLIIGNTSGISHLFINAGDKNSPKWAGFAAPSPGSNPQPAYADLDNDGDLDLLMGSDDGFSYGYENVGSDTLPIWSQKSAWDAPDV